MVQKNSSGVKSKKNPLWERITEAFGTKDVQTIADKLEIKYQAVYKWKNDKAEPSRKRYEEISRTTGKNIDWLMTGKDNLTDQEREENRFSRLSNKFGALTPSKRARAEVLIETLEREIERMETETD